MKFLSILFAFSLMAVTALAADVSGTWKGTADIQGNTVERTFVFKVDGTKLSGETTSEMMGKSTITEGQVDGDNVSFTINVKFQDNEMKLTFKGKVSGDSLKFDVEGVGGQAIVYNCKRVS